MLTETFSGWLRDGAITAPKILAGEITAAKLNVSEVFSDSVVASNIAANSVTAANIKSVLVSTDKLVADQIAGNTITGDLIASRTILAGNIAAGEITGNEIQGNSVNADRLVSNSITAGQIEAGAISSTELNVSEIFADTAVIGAIQSSSITTAAVVAAIGSFEFVESDNIAANAITAGKLAASNVVTNSAQISNGIITNAKIGDIIQSSNYSPGSAGWIINKNGSAEFNGVVVSRNLIVATGSQTLSDRSGLFNNDITTLETIYIEGVYPAGFAAWGGSNATLLCNVEMSGSFSTFVGSESTAMLGPVATILPLTKFQGMQAFTLKIEMVGRRISGWGSPSNLTLNWKVYKVI
jgi:hypothetical protein